MENSSLKVRAAAALEPAVPLGVLSVDCAAPAASSSSAVLDSALLPASGEEGAKPASPSPLLVLTKSCERD